MLGVWLIIYNAIAVPLGLAVIYLGSLFNEKIRTGLRGRRASWLEINRFHQRHHGREVIIIHSASLGEYEQAKPVIRGLKTLRPDYLIVATFTSPSGFTHAERLPEVELQLYLPMDTYFRMRLFLQKMRPAKLIFVTYELWPNLIFNAIRHHVPTYLMSARIRENSLKWRPLIRSFFADLYRSLNHIYAISENDRRALQKLIGSVPIKVLNLGDTRYDQVIQRARDRIRLTLPTLLPQRLVLIAGSIWPQDARHLIPAGLRLMHHFPQFAMIIAPHEPTAYALEMFEDSFRHENIREVRLSAWQAARPELQVVLVDRVGILAELYHQSQIAFIGGSFRGSIHNVMEPAVAGIPVLFGPTYHNSREAGLLLQEKGGVCCPDADALYRIIARLITDPSFYAQTASAARGVIIRNLGAAARTVKEILESD